MSYRVNREKKLSDDAVYFIIVTLVVVAFNNLHSTEMK